MGSKIMTKPFRIEHNVETNEIIQIELTQAEIDELNHQLELEQLAKNGGDVPA